MDPLGKTNSISHILAIQAFQTEKAKEAKTRTTDEKIADKRTDNTKEIARTNSPPARVQSPMLTAIERTLTLGSELALVLGEQLYAAGRRAMAEIAQNLTPRQRQTAARAGDASPAAVQAGLYAHLAAQLPPLANIVIERLRNNLNFKPGAITTAMLILIDLPEITGSTAGGRPT